MKKLIAIVIFLFISCTLYSQFFEIRKVYQGRMDISGQSYTEKIYEIQCKGDTCIALSRYVGAYTILLKSTDGGETWEEIYNDAPIGDDYRGVRTTAEDCVFENNHIYFIGRAKILHIIDIEGELVDTLKFDSPDSLLDLHQRDSLGIVSTWPHYYTTSDNWKTYKKFETDQKLSLYDTYITPDFKIHGVAYADESYSESPGYKHVVSLDTGKTWIINDLPFPEVRSFSIFMVNSEVGYIAGSRRITSDLDTDIVYKTTTGGDSWNVVRDTNDLPQERLLDVAFQNESNGILVGKTGKVVLTFDGGETWMSQNMYKELSYPFMLNASYSNKYAMFGNHIGQIFIIDKVVSVSESNNTELLCYPNPFYESVTISFPEFMSGEAKIEIYNSVGLLIEQGNFTIGGGEMHFTPNADVPGVYFYRITHGTEIYQGNFVKME
jgi:hypothetical protein